MMRQFKSSFVSASSNPQNQTLNQSNILSGKNPVLSGFVSGGSIGGQSYPNAGANPGVSSRESESQRPPERFETVQYILTFIHFFHISK